jgi:hypothetical protein
MSFVRGFWGLVGFLGPVGFLVGFWVQTREGIALAFKSYKRGIDTERVYPMHTDIGRMG